MMNSVQITIWSCFSLLFLLSLETVFREVAAQQPTVCPYAKYVTKEVHTACLPANNSCNIVASGVDKATQQTILNLINNIRSKTAQGKQPGANSVNLPQGSDMRQLVWNDELAAIAQAHANQCVLGFDCFDCRTVENYPVGQDVSYYFYNSQPPKVNWPGAVAQWAKSSNQLSTVLAGKYKISAFTQLIWALSKDIGCGFTRFRAIQANTRFIDLFVCNFGPAGNYGDLNVYESGAVCTECTFASTCCDLTCQSRNVKADYPGLCKLYGQ